MIDEKIRAWFNRFASNNNLTPAEALRMLNNAELEGLRWTLAEYIAYGRENALNGAWVKELENASAKVHIQRLEALKLQVMGELEKLGNTTSETVNDHIIKTYQDNLYKAAYEIQKGTGVGIDFLKINTDKVNVIIHKPWAVNGENFSELLWRDKNKMINTTYQALTRMALTGGNPETAIKEISHTLKVSRANAGRVVMTESAVFANNANLEAMKRNGVKEYKVVETLDSLTCDVCGKHDGEHYPLSRYEVGVTAPVFHPNCRGSIAPYKVALYADILEGVGKRAARGKDGKTVLIDRNITFDEWKERFLKDEQP